MLLAAAQIRRPVVAIFEMQADGVLIELPAGIEIGHVEHDVAAPDDVERRIENVLRNGHVYFLVSNFILMVRRRVSAVSNHGSRGPSFETRAKARSSG
jgi:hypothetical protein